MNNIPMSIQNSSFVTMPSKLENQKKCLFGFNHSVYLCEGRYTHKVNSNRFLTSGYKIYGQSRVQNVSVSLITSYNLRQNLLRQIIRMSVNISYFLCGERKIGFTMPIPLAPITMLEGRGKNFKI